MIQVRKSEERGYFDHGWLKTYHTFSFSGYRDPEHMGFRVLRVINEDFVQPGQGFGTHPHHDMEIVTYVLSGRLEHKDSLGNGSIIGPGEFQRMSAGTGVTHSEFNPSADEPVHLLQIWLFPEQKGLEPSYEQKSFPAANDGPLQVVASPDARDGSLTIHQDATLTVGRLEADVETTVPIAPGRHAWLQVIEGELELNGTALRAGDGAAVNEEERLAVTAGGATEFLLFDLP